MAGWKGHIGGGLICMSVYVAVISFMPIGYMANLEGFSQNWQTLIAIFFVGMLFTIFPDIDTNSKAQDIFIGFAFLLDVLLIAIGSVQLAAYLGLITMLPIISHHRGWTHRLWAMLIVPLPILIVPYLYKDSLLSVAAIYYGAALIGYFSHLFFDGIIWRIFLNLFRGNHT